MLKVNYYILFFLAGLFFNSANVLCCSSQQQNKTASSSAVRPANNLRPKFLLDHIYTYNLPAQREDANKATTPEQSVSLSLYQPTEKSVTPCSSLSSSRSITPQPHNWHFNSANNTFIPPVTFSNGNSNNTFTTNSAPLPMVHASGHFNNTSPSFMSNQSLPSNNTGAFANTNNKAAVSDAKTKEVANEKKITEQSLFPSMHQHFQSAASIGSSFPINSSITPQPCIWPFNNSTNTFIPPLILSDWGFNNSTNTFDNRISSLIPDALSLSHTTDRTANTNNNTIPLYTRTQEVADINQDKELAPAKRKKHTKTYTCPTCHKKLANQNSLNYHIKTHNPNRARPYQCHLCNKSFTEKGILKIHLNRHNKEKSFLCDFCSRRFKSKQEKMVHHRTHTKEKPYKCALCNKCFARQDTLKSHIRTHTGEKPFKCDICQKRLCSKVSLENHLSKHKGAKPYKCSQCTKAYATERGLKSHLKRHNRPKPYTCPYCDAAFVHKSEYKSHIHYEEATDEERKCHRCKKAYTDKRCLIQHNKRAYSDT